MFIFIFIFLFIVFTFFNFLLLLTFINILFCIKEHIAHGISFIVYWPSGLIYTLSEYIMTTFPKYLFLHCCVEMIIVI